MLGLIQPRTKLDYLLPRASLIISSVDHPKKAKCQVAVHSSRTNSTVPLQKNVVSKLEFPKLVTSKEQILSNYPDDLEGIGRFSGALYYIQCDPSGTPKQTPSHSILVHLKEAFQQEVTKML